MSNITKADIVYLSNNLFRAKTYPGISWGTDAIPPDALSGWFNGPVGGLGYSAAGEVTAAVPTAQNVVDLMRNTFNAHAGIRLTRIVIYKSMNGYEPKRSNNKAYHAWTKVIYDNTAIANTNYPATDAPSFAGYLSAGTPINYSQVSALMNAVYSAYVNTVRNTLATLTHTVCHYNCHTNCHDSRGRR